MALFLGMTLAVWVGASLVVMSLCVAAARGDRALAALETARVPSVSDGELARSQRDQQAA